MAAGGIEDVGSAIVKVDGKVVAEASAGPGGSDEKSGFLMSVQVDKRIDCPDMFQFDLSIRTGSQIQILDDLREGKGVEILMGKAGSEKTVMKGEIQYIEPHFRHSAPSTVTVAGYDSSHRLTRGNMSRTWGDGYQAQDMYPSVVQDVVNQAQDMNGKRDGLSPNTVQSPSVQANYIPQYNVSDYQFMKWLGQDVDKTVDADTATDDKKVSFQAIDPSKQPVKTLVREAQKAATEFLIGEANFSLSTVRQVAKVIVRGWDHKAKKAIQGVATASDYSFGGTEGFKATGKALYGDQSAGKVLTIVDRPVDSAAEAEKVAKAIFNQLSMEFVTGDVDFEGDEKIAAGDIIEMKDFGDRFSGKYLVTAVTHSYATRGGGFRTRCKLARNDVGKV